MLRQLQKAPVRDTEFPADDRAGYRLVLLDGFDDLFFAVALLDAEIS